MSTITRFLGRTGQVLAATAIAAGLAAGLAATPASAGPMPKSKLTITPVSSTQYRVSIVGVFPMTQADAQGYLNNMGSQGGMRFNIRGDDFNEEGPRFSQRFYGLTANNSPTDAALHATPEGLRFARSLIVNRSVLNEDVGPIDFTDEIYVAAQFIDGDNGERPSRSNVVSGNF